MSVGAVHSNSTVSVVSFDIAVKLKQVGHEVKRRFFNANVRCIQTSAVCARFVLKPDTMCS